MSKPVQLLQQQTSQLQAQIQTAASSTAAPTNMMTTDTPQTITANKTFAGDRTEIDTTNGRTLIIYADEDGGIQIHKHITPTGSESSWRTISIPFSAENEYVILSEFAQTLENKTLIEPVIATVKQSGEGGIIKLPTVAAGSTATLAKAARVRTSLTIREFDRTHYKTNIPIADCDLTHYKLFYDILNSIF